MRRSQFDSFIRTGGTKTLVLNLSSRPVPEVKQDARSMEDSVDAWMDEVWNPTYGAASQAILKARPFEFSTEDLADQDREALREFASAAVLAAMQREGFLLESVQGRARALSVLFAYLNQALQAAIGIDFYTWQTRRDAQVRDSHAERDGKVFRWDTPPEGGHPGEAYNCRCYARPLGIEGYWQHVGEGVNTYAPDAHIWEGSVDHMYLDTTDHVTVGVGTLLPNADAAAALAFRHRGSQALASEAEIRAEYETIDAMQGSEFIGAGYYEQFTTLFLRQEDMEPLVYDHMREIFDALLRLFPYFGNYPQSVQIALWDMAYNLGVNGLRSDFPNFCQAVRDEDWERAAAESHRSQPGEGRNDFVFNLFMDAVVP